MQASDAYSPVHREIHCIPLTTSQQLSSWRGQLHQEARAQRIAANQNRKVYRKPTMPLTTYMPPTRLAAVLAAVNAGRGGRKAGQASAAPQLVSKDPASAGCAAATNLDHEQPNPVQATVRFSEIDQRSLDQGRNAEALRRSLGEVLARVAEEEQRKPGVGSTSRTQANGGSLSQRVSFRSAENTVADAPEQPGSADWRSGKSYRDFLALAKSAHAQVRAEVEEADRRNRGKQHEVIYPWRTDIDDPPPEVVATIMTKHAAADRYHANGGLLQPWGTQRDLPKPVVPVLRPQHRQRPMSACSNNAGSSSMETASLRAISTRVSSARSIRTPRSSTWLDQGSIQAAGISLGKGSYTLPSNIPRTWRSAW